MTYPSGNFYEGDWSLDKKEGYFSSIDFFLIDMVQCLGYKKMRNIMVFGKIINKMDSESTYGWKLKERAKC